MEGVLKEVGKDISGLPIVGNFTFTQQMPNGRTMQMAGYLYHGQDIEEINATLDLCQEVMERQRVRLEVAELDLRVEMLGKQLEMTLEAHTGLMKREAGDGRKLNAAERGHLQNYPITIEKIRKEIEEGKAKVAEARRKGGLDS
jgi:isopentenyl diphosphate isomerase/L-lactate dehydrogenase-like FMN-dependent dehydrogenase